MRCNSAFKINKENDNVLIAFDDVASKIRRKMNYSELVENSIFANRDNAPDMPSIIEKVSVSFKNTIYGNKFYGLIDISSIDYFTPDEGMCAMYPLTPELLNLYGVTPEKFIRDYINKQVVSFIIP